MVNCPKTLYEFNQNRIYMIIDCENRLLNTIQYSKFYLGNKLIRRVSNRKPLGLHIEKKIRVTVHPRAYNYRALRPCVPPSVPASLCPSLRPFVPPSVRPSVPPFLPLSPSLSLPQSLHLFLSLFLSSLNFLSKCKYDIIV